MGSNFYEFNKFNTLDFESDVFSLVSRVFLLMPKGREVIFSTSQTKVKINLLRFGKMSSNWNAEDMCFGGSTLVEAYKFIVASWQLKGFKRSVFSEKIHSEIWYRLPKSLPSLALLKGSARQCNNNILIFLSNSGFIELLW